MRGYKIRIYPNKAQEEILNKTFGCRRFIWNQLLEDVKRSYELNKTFERRTLKQLKENFPFLCEVSQQSKNNAEIDFNTALNRFLKDRKSSKNHKVKFPRFKSKRGLQSYRTCQVSKSIQRGNHFFLETLGLVKYKHHFDVDFNSLTIKSVTVKKYPSGKYYASLLVENPPKKEHQEATKEIGIDLGVKDFITLSDGTKISNPKHSEKAELRLRTIQKEFSRAQKGSKNHEKIRIKLAKAYEKVSNQREDFLHKLSTKLINENQVICLETLNISNMLRNHHLAKAIQSVSWNIFVKMLEYKAEDAGRSLVKIDRFYPSSKLCHHCGYKNENLQLKDRSWKCPQCGSELDRDINASVNILNEGLKLLNHRAYGDSLCKLEINTEVHRESQQILLKRNV